MYQLRQIKINRDVYNCKADYIVDAYFLFYF